MHGSVSDCNVFYHFSTQNELELSTQWDDPPSAVSQHCKATSPKAGTWGERKGQQGKSSTFIQSSITELALGNQSAFPF